MGTILVRVYDNFYTAQMARSELLRFGFHTENVQLRAGEDEAGPVQGNFVLGSKDEAPAARKEFFVRLFGKGRADPNSRARQNHHTEVIHRGNFLLTVEAGDDLQYDRAADILGRFLSIDVEQRTAQRRQDQTPLR